MYTHPHLNDIGITGNRLCKFYVFETIKMLADMLGYKITSAENGFIEYKPKGR